MKKEFTPFYSLLFGVLFCLILSSCVSSSTHNKTVMKLDSLQLEYSKLLDTIVQHKLNPEKLAKSAKLARDAQNFKELIKINDIFKTYYPENSNSEIVKAYTIKLNSIIEAKKARNAVKYCTISGVVRYLFNDYIGYKVDAGAKVIAIKVTDSSTKLLKYDQYVRYSSRANVAMRYYIAVAKHGDWISKNKIRKQVKFSEYDETQLKILADSIGLISLNVMTAKKNGTKYYETFVDASGSYEMKIPYGEYYLIFISENKKRPLIPEILNVVNIRKKIINKPTLINSCDFVI